MPPGAYPPGAMPPGMMMPPGMQPGMGAPGQPSISADLPGGGPFIPKASSEPLLVWALVPLLVVLSLLRPYQPALQLLQVLLTQAIVVLQLLLP